MQAQSTVRYLSAAETAKLVRSALKRDFPGQKFSVRSETYSGGASIDVRWVNGPRRAAVEPIAKQYQGGGFDGSIDMQYSRSHFLRPDGSVLVAYDAGTIGSGGYHQPEDNTALEPVLPDDAERVHFGATFVFCERTISDETVITASAEAWIRDYCHVSTGTRPEYDMFGNDYVTNMAASMARDAEVGEDWHAVFERRHG